MSNKYRKKPVVIEAIQLNKDTFVEIENMLIDKGTAEFSIDLDGSYTLESVTIASLEGDMRADIGDYIIKGIEGEFYPCKPDIFKLTYEEVQDND